MEVTLDRFQLGHYAMLLNVFPFDTSSNEMLMTPERDYMNYLPLERLKPFERENFHVVCKKERNMELFGTIIA